MIRLLLLQPWTKSTLTIWYARGDSNSRTRLRRPVLYPLSYGRVPGDYTDTIGSVATPGLCGWVELVAPLPQCYNISTHVHPK